MALAESRSASVKKNGPAIVLDLTLKTLTAFLAAGGKSAGLGIENHKSGVPSRLLSM